MCSRLFRGKKTSCWDAVEEMASLVKEEKGLLWFSTARDDPLKEPLLTAIKSGKLKAVKEILASHPSLVYQETLDIALETACNCRKKPEVELLLRSGARAQHCLHALADDVTKKNNSITTVEKEIIQLLLENSHKKHKRAVLSKAISEGRSDLIDLLLASKIGLNSKDSLSRALFKALNHGHIECIEVLMRHGGKIDVEKAFLATLRGNACRPSHETLKLFPQLYKQSFKNVESINRILHEVVSFGNIEFLKFMMESETNLINLITDQDQLLIRTKNAQVLQFLIDHGVVIHDSVTICSHVLDLIRQEKLDMVKIYFDHGLNVNSETFNTGHKGTPLTEARNAETVQYLIDKGANVNERISKSVEWEQIVSTTALFEALYKKDEVLKVLLENGADPEFTDYEGHTALMAASLILDREDRENKVEMLLKAGAEVNKLTERGETALSLMIGRRHDTTKSVKMLLQHGADVNIIGSNKSVLLNAMGPNKYETIQMLVESGMNAKTINTCDEDGHTPLIMAVTLFPDDEASKLINIFSTAGADLNKRGGDGYTALMRAAEHKNHLAVKALIEAGADVNVGLNQLHSTDSAILILLNAEYHCQGSLLCIDELLNHGAQTSNVRSESFQELIERNVSWLTPKIIQNGYAPDGKYHKSPLSIALENGRDKIACYLLGNRFLTKSDILFKLESQPCYPPCEELLTELKSQPFSLLNLSFVEVSSALGSGPDREKKVRKSGLPPMLQTKLLFKTEEVALAVDEEEKNAVLKSFDFREEFALYDPWPWGFQDYSNDEDSYGYGYDDIYSNEDSYGNVHHYFFDDYYNGHYYDNSDDDKIYW